nr:very short patch repair endonuclease [uncultured Sphaerochaeta sp.]
MTDIYSKIKRSKIMSKISGKNTKPEIIIRKIAHKLGHRFRLHRKDLPGKPDIVFPKYKKVIFVNGCFWHGHKNCSRSTLPITRKKFWQEKIGANKRRDKRNKAALTKLGWSYLVIWQCEIKNSTFSKIENKINQFLTS